jgi:hypothetical protein
MPCGEAGFGHRRKDFQRVQGYAELELNPEDARKELARRANRKISTAVDSYRGDFTCQVSLDLTALTIPAMPSCHG